MGGAGPRIVDERLGIFFWCVRRNHGSLVVIHVGCTTSL